ncbi:MAG TPA: 50S ribosomal protein L5 [Patescibacteria group bacterium]|nr:50S ribosomal protein L5 [Patescibacteria group bacterium]
MNRLKEIYNKKIAPQLMKEFNLSNVMEVPRIRKVAINTGIGSFRDSREAVETYVNELSQLSGQKPFPRKARKSEAGFKVRKNDVVGYAVTLRGDKMWAFLDKFVNIVLPRVRDFRGLDTSSFDENGNYSIGVREHVIFPEINPNNIKGIRSLQVTVVTDGKDKKQNLELLKELGFPFKKEER